MILGFFYVQHISERSRYIATHQKKIDKDFHRGRIQFVHCTICAKLFDPAVFNGQT